MVLPSVKSAHLLHVVFFSERLHRWSCNSWLNVNSFWMFTGIFYFLLFFTAITTIHILLLLLMHLLLIIIYYHYCYYFFFQYYYNIRTCRLWNSDHVPHYYYCRCYSNGFPPLACLLACCCCWFKVEFGLFSVGNNFSGLLNSFLFPPNPLASRRRCLLLIYRALVVKFFFATNVRLMISTVRIGGRIFREFSTASRRNKTAVSADLLLYVRKRLVASTKLTRTSLGKVENNSHSGPRPIRCKPKFNKKKKKQRRRKKK